MLRLFLLICAFLVKQACCFTIPSSELTSTFKYRTSAVQPAESPSTRLFAKERRTIDDDDEDEFEFARVRRKRGRFADDYGEDTERESARGGARTGSRDAGTRRKYDDDYDEIDFEENDYYDDDEYDEFDSDDEDEYDDEDDDYDEIIPNALLDQIDPDGAIDRLPELFADTKFWKDSALWFLLGFVYLLNRFNNPNLNGVVDLDKVDFTQFYNQPPPGM